MNLNAKKCTHYSNSDDQPTSAVHIIYNTYTFIHWVERNDTKGKFK